LLNSEKDRIPPGFLPWDPRGDLSEGVLLLAFIVTRLQIVSRYSDRKAEHWFHGERNGLSIAGELRLDHVLLPYKDSI
jgi:hypothetical protein